MKKPNLDKAYKGSYYTISGTGGNLQEWITGYEKELAAAGIGKPSEWLLTSGADVNNFAGKKGFINDPFHPQVGILMFPLDGLNIGKLALFRLQWNDRWFDDIINNMVSQNGG